MDSWEFNKIAAAVLSALLVIFGGTTILDLSHAGHGDKHDKPGYALPVAADAGGAAPGAPAAAAFDAAAVVAQLAKADAKAGESVFRQCKSCHTINDGGKDSIGPNLHNIVGRKIGGHGNFKYSKVLAEKGGNWDYTKLVEFLHKPKSWAPGTKMAFNGISRNDDLANLIMYLRAQSASPPALPAAK